MVGSTNFISEKVEFLNTLMTIDHLTVGKFWISSEMLEVEFGLRMRKLELEVDLS